MKPKNAGQSDAMYAGCHAARSEVIVLLDGDLQNDPADIPELLAEIEKGANLVCGYRAKRRDNLAKKISSRVANAIRSRFTKDGVRDTGCSLKAMRVECRTALVPFKGMHRFIPALVKGAGYRLVEIPVNHRPRLARESKYKSAAASSKRRRTCSPCAGFFHGSCGIGSKARRKIMETEGIDPSINNNIAKISIRLKVPLSPFSTSL